MVKSILMNPVMVSSFEDYYTGEPKIMEGHCSSNSDGSITLHIDRVYSKKYNDLRNNDYVFYETDG